MRVLFIMHLFCYAFICYMLRNVENMSFPNKIINFLRSLSLSLLLLRIHFHLKHRSHEKILWICNSHVLNSKIFCMCSVYRITWIFHPSSGKNIPFLNGTNMIQIIIDIYFRTFINIQWITVYSMNNNGEFEDRNTHNGILKWLCKRAGYKIFKLILWPLTAYIVELCIQVTIYMIPVCVNLINILLLLICNLYKANDLTLFLGYNYVWK